MRKLLAANFSRLKRDKVFWIGMAAVLILSVVYMAGNCNYAVKLQKDGYYTALEEFYFSIVPAMGILTAIHTVLFLGTEYSDGTIRNKVVIGHSRRDIYLAGFLTCLAANVCFMAAMYVGGLVGIPILGIWKIGVGRVLLLILVTILFTAALTGIFTLLCMLYANRAVAVVLAVLLFLGMLICGAGIYNSLCEPEEISGIVMEDGEMKMAEPSPNPSYVSGKKRVMYEWLLDILPTGQGILVANVETAHPFRQMGASAVIVLISTGAGVVFFKRKDIQ